MFSSLGFDRKSAGRPATRNPSKYLREVPRGFSVHVFGNPAPPPAVIPTKLEYTESQSRSASNTTWLKPSSNLPRQDVDRKPTPPDTRHQLSVYAPPFEPKRSKSQRPYQIHASAIPDTYIYERSLSSASDLLASPASTSSSDSDFNAESSLSLAVEISSTRARSSTETLETTALEQTPRRSSPTTTSDIRSVQYAPPNPTLRGQRGAVPSDDDSDTVVSDVEDDIAPVHYLAEPTATRAPTNSIGASLPLSTPLPRGTSERSSPTRPPNATSVSSIRPPLHSIRTDSSTISYDENTPRAPPGLQPTASAKPNSAETSLFGRVVDVASRRTVRWKEELCSDEPIRRRKGWFNRRGDQLWTNDGRFRSPSAGQEYPPDLDKYPEPDTGWMNENGVRIDIQHRLIPPRPALKRSKPTTTT